MAGDASATSRTAIQEYRKEQFLISTDPAKLDVTSIHAFLSGSYWADGISKEIVERAIRGSLCFGIYDGAQQVGFARVITDRATFAYICDDYILESHQGRGLGRWLMECILDHPDLQGLRRWSLVTKDARIYEKFGFTLPKGPEYYMEILDSEIYKKS